VRQAGSRAQKGRIDDHGEDAAPLLEGHLRQGRLAARAGVVDQDVEPAVALDRLAHQPLDGRRVGHVGHAKSGPAARVFDQVHGLLRHLDRSVDVDHDGRATGRQVARDSAADVARAARDQRHLALELVTLLHRPSSGAGQPASGSTMNVREPRFKATWAAFGRGLLDNLRHSNAPKSATHERKGRSHPFLARSKSIRGERKTCIRRRIMARTPTKDTAGYAAAPQS
jgi:hypothetical protein